MKTLILLVGNHILMHLVTTCRSPKLRRMKLILIIVIRATAVPGLARLAPSTVWEHRTVIVAVDDIFVFHVLNDNRCSTRVRK